MFTDEMIISMAIDEAGELTTKPTNHSKKITGKHISYLYNSQVRRGYFTETGLKGCEVTRNGWNAILREAILLILCEDRATAKSRIEKLERLYTEINQQIDKPGKEASS